MKKSILIGMLAVLMLLAFTACNNEVPTYKVPISMTAQASKTEYLVGETLDASTVTATVYYSDGSTQTFTGTDVGASTEKINEGINNVPVWFGTGEKETTGSYKKGTVGASVSVMGYSVESATVTGLPTAATWDETTKKPSLDLSNASVVVSYNGTTRTLSSDEYELVIDISSIGAGQKDAPSSMTLAVFGTDVSTKTTWPEDYEVSVPNYADGDFDETRTPITYTVEVKKGTESVVSGGTYYIGETITYEVYKVDADGDKEAATPDTDYVFVGTKPASKSIELKADNLKGAVTYKISVLGSSSTMSITIPKATDYVKEITSIVPKTEGGPRPGGIASDSNYNFMGRMASAEASSEPIVLTTGFKAQIIDSDVPAQPAAGSPAVSFAPRFEVRYGMYVDGEYANSTGDNPIVAQAYEIPAATN